jgi:hypothetical protein
VGRACTHAHRAGRGSCSPCWLPISGVDPEREVRCGIPVALGSSTPRSSTRVTGCISLLIQIPKTKKQNEPGGSRRKIAYTAPRTTRAWTRESAGPGRWGGCTPTHTSHAARARAPARTRAHATLCDWNTPPLRHSPASVAVNQLIVYIGNPLRRIEKVCWSAAFYL